MYLIRATRISCMYKCEINEKRKNFCNSQRKIALDFQFSRLIYIDKRIELIGKNETGGRLQTLNLVCDDRLNLISESY